MRGRAAALSLRESLAHLCLTPLPKPLGAIKPPHAAVSAAEIMPGDIPSQLLEAEFETLRALAETQCSNNADHFAKLRYLLDYESHLEGRAPDMSDDFGSVLVAIDMHLNPEA